MRNRKLMADLTSKGRTGTVQISVELQSLEGKLKLAILDTTHVCLIYLKAKSRW